MEDDYVDADDIKWIKAIKNFIIRRPPLRKDENGLFDMIEFS